MFAKFLGPFKERYRRNRLKESIDLQVGQICDFLGQWGNPYRFFRHEKLEIVNAHNRRLVLLQQGENQVVVFDTRDDFVGYSKVYVFREGCWIDDLKPLVEKAKARRQAEDEAERLKKRTNLQPIDDCKRVPPQPTEI